MQSQFAALPDPPENVTSANILARFIDSMAFRYYWSLEGTPSSFYHFQPAEDTPKVGLLLKHIYELSAKSFQCIEGNPPPFNDQWDLHEIKNQNLDLWDHFSRGLQNMDEKTLTQCKIYHKRSGKFLSFWYLINGPLTDILTHIGQINTWRRIAGNPPAKIDMVGGQPVHE